MDAMHATNKWASLNIVQLAAEMRTLPDITDYCHARMEKDLQAARRVIGEPCPAYARDFETVMKRRGAHMRNMFVMKKTLFDDYCLWLFGILSELDRRTDLTGYSVLEARVFGFIAELLPDVWLLHRHVSYKELNVLQLEKPNTLKRGMDFLKRKYFRPAAGRAC